jgi:hypothetical protein
MFLFSPKISKYSRSEVIDCRVFVEVAFFITIGENYFPELLLTIALEIDSLGYVVACIIVVGALSEQKLWILLGTVLHVVVEHCFQLPARAKWKLLQDCFSDFDSIHRYFKDNRWLRRVWQQHRSGMINNDLTFKRNITIENDSVFIEEVGVNLIDLREIDSSQEIGVALESLICISLNHDIICC